ncbi:MAG: fibronectin type III domain-containing protein [Bacteroidaceae bacterium]|nr:fibronectin type III domain-containing protein [Bacteroidaceae bacterium]
MESGELATLLSGLTKGTKYVVQVQAVMSDGKTSEWSPVVKFTILGEGEMVLFDDADNQNEIGQNNGNEVNVTLQGRTLCKDGSWNTLCLPFNAELTGVLDGATLMELDTDEGSYEHKTGFEDGTLYLNFKSVNTIVAGKPYIIRWENTSGVIENPVFKGVTIVNEINNMTSIAPSDVTFVGTYSPIDIYTSDKTNLYLGADNTLYYPWSDDMTSFKVNAFRAYFKLNNGIVCGEPGQAQVNSITAFVLNFGDEETTGIVDAGFSSLDSRISNPLQQTWYSVDGRRLNGNPISKGIYINNGRKVVIK